MPAGTSDLQRERYMGCLVGKLETLQQWVLGGEMHNHLGARKKCNDGRR